MLKDEEEGRRRKEEGNINLHVRTKEEGIMKITESASRGKEMHPTKTYNEYISCIRYYQNSKIVK